MSTTAVVTNGRSCDRCKGKKVRCSRELPQCEKCRATGAACCYSKRRLPVRKSRIQKEALSNIMERLKLVEERLGLSLGRNSLHSTVDNEQPEQPISDSEDSGQGEGEEICEKLDIEPETSMYRMVTEATNSALNALSLSEELRPEDSAINTNTVAALSNALAEIQDFKFNGDSNTESVEHIDIPRGFAKRWVDPTFQHNSASDFLLGLVDRDLMKAIPDIIDTPYVRLDNSIQILYYDLLFQGSLIDEVEIPNRGEYRQSIYFKILKLIPDWLGEATSTIVDFVAAFLTTWVAIEHFDYHLAWRIHCEACKVARKLNLHVLDQEPVQTTQDGPLQDEKRKLFWQLVQTDCLFRLNYGKPPMITASEWNVNFPSLSSESPDTWKPSTAIVFLLSSRITCITLEFFNVTEGRSANGSGIDVSENVKGFCDQIEGLLTEWNKENWLKTTDNSDHNKWIYADLVISGYTTIILMDRRGKPNPDAEISQRSLRAARKVLDGIFLLSNSTRMDYFLSLNFIAFYPFVAFFALYYNILAVGKSEGPISWAAEAHSDLALMEKLGAFLNKAAPVRTDFAPVANAINALNKVSHHILSNKQRKSLSPSNSKRQVLSVNSPSPMNNGQPQDIGTLGSSNAIDMSMQLPLQIDVAMASNFDIQLGGLGMNFDQGLQSPLEYMRAIEDNFTAMNWHEH